MVLICGLQLSWLTHALSHAVSYVYSDDDGEYKQFLPYCPMPDNHACYAHILLHYWEGLLRGDEL